MFHTCFIDKHHVECENDLNLKLITCSAEKVKKKKKKNIFQTSELYNVIALLTQREHVMKHYILVLIHYILYILRKMLS